MKKFLAKLINGSKINKGQSVKGLPSNFLKDLLNNKQLNISVFTSSQNLAFSIEDTSYVDFKNKESKNLFEAAMEAPLDETK